MKRLESREDDLEEREATPQEGQFLIEDVLFDSYADTTKIYVAPQKTRALYELEVSSLKTIKVHEVRDTMEISSSKNIAA